MDGLEVPLNEGGESGRPVAPFADFAEAASAAFGRFAQVDNIPPEDLILRLLSTLRAADARCQAAIERAERAESDSMVDPLTDLANRRGWVKALEIEEARCRRFGLPASIAVIDLDDLKLINDTSGHSAGDDVLRKAAETILGQTRAHDIVARLGGDEFGLLAVDCDRDEANALGLRLSESLAAVGISASIGMATSDESLELREVWDKADVAMYRAKQDGKVDVSITQRGPDPQPASDS